MKSDTTQFKYDDATAKAFLERMDASAASECADREKLRNQLKALTLSLSVTIFGFAVGRKHQNAVVLLSVPFFCLFMHVLDTFLDDLSRRQVKHRMRLNLYLLGFDSLNEKDIQLALRKAFQGNWESNWLRKVHLFFCAGLFDCLWHWGLFIVTLLLSLGVIFREELCQSLKGLLS